jgi:beta-phosphoglucomutase-like phosphatase (HAD superfamily)
MSEAIAAVVFDLDGVLVDSESIWDAARREVVARNGGRWQADATRAMMGMSSPEVTCTTNSACRSSPSRSTHS